MGSWDLCVCVCVEERVSIRYYARQLKIGTLEPSGLYGGRTDTRTSTVMVVVICTNSLRAQLDPTQGWVAKLMISISNFS